MLKNKAKISMYRPRCGDAAKVSLTGERGCIAYLPGEVTMDYCYQAFRLFFYLHKVELLINELSLT
jgi:hypothetical protein